MAGKKKPMKGKKKRMGYLLVGLFLMLMTPSVWAADLSYGLADIPTRVTAGYTLLAGTSDPGEAGAIGLNDVLGAVNHNLAIPGFVVSWKDQRLLEFGVLSGGWTGAASNDAASPERKSYAFVGVGAYLLEGIMANAVYVLDSGAQHNVMAFVGVDVARLGPKLVSLTSAAWGKTGL